MIKLYLIALFFALSATSQNDTKFILGKWHVITANDNEIAYDSRTDEIKLLNTTKTLYSQEQLNRMKEAIKTMIIGSTFEFENGGKAKIHYEQLGQEIGVFSVDDIQKQILFEGKNSLGEDVSETFDYEIEEKYLHFLIPVDSGKLNLTLEKNN